MVNPISECSKLAQKYKMWPDWVEKSVTLEIVQEIKIWSYYQMVYTAMG